MINERRYSLFIILLACLTLWTCDDGIDKDMISGKWKAAELREGTHKSERDLSPIFFEFRKDGTYDYQGTLKYKESGRWYTIGQLLYSTDTLAADRREKAVKVIRLSSDSLYFEMNNEGTPQLLMLYRVDDF